MVDCWLVVSVRCRTIVRLALTPRSAFNGRTALVDHDTLWPRPGIDPQHFHRGVGLVDEIVDPPARLQGRGAVLHRVAAALDHAGGLARDDANAFVEIVN